MSLGLLVTLVVAAGLAVGFITYAAIFHKLIENMSGMVFAMAVGMMTGLMMAVIIGALWQGQLLSSTLVGILIGITAGFFGGLPFGSFAIMDGMLSGMMGGMMGAMLGEMIPSDQSDLLVKMIFLLYVSLVVILFYLLRDTLRKRTGMLSNPLITAVILVLFFVSYNQLEIFSASGNQNTGHQHNSQSQPSSEVIVKAGEFKFLSNTIHVNADESVKLTLKNTGNIKHSLKIINIENEQVHIHAAPGKSNTVTFIPEKTGTYRFICTIPGHKEHGMVGTLIVM